jgi:phenylacetaldehyde dehydrogenase
LWKWSDLLEANVNGLAQLETINNGMPIAIAQMALAESIKMLRYYSGMTSEIHGKAQHSKSGSNGGNTLAYTTREPVGVVGQIIPWNGPILMAIWKMAPALAAGCTLVLKPDEKTPLTALWLGALAIEAGFPKGVINIVPGLGEEAGAALAAHSDIDKIAFTGSPEVGREIVKASAGNFKRVSLELGGKSPNIIFSDANLEIAIPTAVQSIFANQGQVCTAGSRLYVEANIFDRVVGAVAMITKGLKVGNGLDPNNHLGPLISNKQLTRVHQYVESGLREGSELITGGKRIGETGYFYEPSIFINCDSQMKIVQEEIFGPVLTIMPFESFDEVVQKSNNTTYGLAAGIWTNDIKKAHALASYLQAGTVWINSYNVFDPACPFGGFKQSGWGRECGPEGLDLYMETKTVMFAL